MSKIVGLKNIIPVTMDDHQHAAKGYSMTLSEIVDRDMVYRNNLEDEDWLFDRDGTWDEEGINHPACSLDNNWQELEYYRNTQEY